MHIVAGDIDMAKTIGCAEQMTDATFTFQVIDFAGSADDLSFTRSYDCTKLLAADF